MKKLILGLVLLTVSFYAFADSYTEAIQTFFNKGNAIYVKGSAALEGATGDIMTAIPRNEIKSIKYGLFSEKEENFKNLIIFTSTEDGEFFFSGKTIKSLTQDSAGNITIELIKLTENTMTDDMQKIYQTLLEHYDF